ncbi:MAG: dihydromonapterin reductase [Shewanella sp.]|nr:dihydromonapterin reductase [Shewanella sp.]MCF1430065.1 dihydromonapterin reductase [Shewanella sp.]MCF1439208.1 dihydromonapterin reductase [Shewanella sp.]MCF1458544.1 dihydromonapterin reductase [Shewanella sp.]
MTNPAFEASSNAPVLITGVGKRIGLFLAQTFLSRGIPVVGTYRTYYPAIESLSEAGVDLYQVDFYQGEQVKGLIEAIRQRYPMLRAIIHNASDWLRDGDLPDCQDVMERMMCVHAKVPYQLNLALVSQLQAGRGDIIHISDFVASKGSSKHIAYAASKAAMDNLTLSFAAKLAPDVKVNSIAPALVCFNETDDEAYRAKSLSKALLPREAGYKELLACVDLLLGSHYITGRILALDGGRHLK